MGKVLPLYYEGALLTLRVGAIGILLALAVGMVTAVARYWRIPILNTAAVIYTEFSRNTPLLVQLFFLYFGLPKVGIRISGEWCAIIGLAFLGGSYMAEALRAGLESVSTVQTESARVLAPYALPDDDARRAAAGVCGIGSAVGRQYHLSH